jgi:protein ImuB
MSFACIFVPDFPAEAILRIEPELRTRAVAVLEGKPPLEKVLAMNEEARRMGIDPGMTKVQVEAFSGLVLRSRSLLQEAAAHSALLDCAQSFSPLVEETASDTIIVDLAGLESLFGAPQKIARDLGRRASDLGLEANIGVAANPDAAMLAARGFSGVTVLDPGSETERLGILPLEVLLAGLPAPRRANDAEEFLQTLERWGLRNLRSLAALPEIPLAERLGQPGIHLQRMARGCISRTLIPYSAAPVFEEAAELDFPLVLLEPLALLLQRLLEQLCARLSSRALATQELRLQMELERGYLADEQTEVATRRAETNAENSDESGLSDASETIRREKRTSLFNRTLHLPVPMLDVKIFLKLLQLDLNAHPPGAPILKVRLSAGPVRPRPSQAGLFVPVSPEPEKLEVTLARISNLVGKDRIGSVELVDTHRPEAFRIQHFTPAAHNKNSKSTDDSPRDGGNSAPVTALRMFRPPLRASVTMSKGRPVYVACPKRKEVQGEITWTAGPWRSSGDWWQQEGWAREEWDIAVQSAAGMALYRLVRDLLQGRWFVEGSYD